MTSTSIDKLGEITKYLFIGSIVGGLLHPYPRLYIALILGLLIIWILLMAWHATVREEEVREEIEQIKSGTKKVL